MSQKKSVNKIKYDSEVIIMILIIFEFDFYELKVTLIRNYEQLKYDLGELEPLDRIKMIIELSKFVLPAFKTIDRKDIVNDLGWGMNDDKWS